MSAATVDLRGFVYSLDAILRKYEWEFEWLQANLATVSGALQTAQTQLALAQEQHRLQQLVVQTALTSRVNPFLHQQSLAYLEQSQANIVNQERQLKKLKTEREILHNDCIEQSIKIQALEKHRETSMTDYVSAEQTRLANEIDRDWSARSVGRQQMAQCTTKADHKLGRV